MRKRLTGSEWGLWLKWIVVYAIGWVVGQIVASFLAWLYFYYAFTALEELSRSSILGAILGIFLGLPTALAIKLQTKQLILWTTSMMVACGFSLFVANGTFRIWHNENLYPLLSGISFGLSVGVAQWMILKYQVRHATWFIAANVVAWLVAQLLPVVELDGAAIGILTGFVLVLLMRNPITASAVEQQGYLSAQKPS